MKVAVDALEELTLRLRDAAVAAAEALASGDDDQPRVDRSRLLLVDRHEAVSALTADASRSLCFDLDGTPSGTAVAAFDGNAAAWLAAGTGESDATGRASDAADVDESEDAFVRTGRRIVGTFLEACRDGAGSDWSGRSRAIDPAADAVSLPSVDADGDEALVFRSRLVVPECDGTVDLLVALDGAGLASVGIDGAPDDDRTVLSLDKLGVFTELTREGTAVAAEHVSAMTGMAATAGITSVSFTPIQELTAHLRAETYVGTTVEFDDLPSGHLVVLFDADAARSVADALLPGGATDEAGFSGMERSALEELGNVVTSGFVDGWANVLERSVDHTPPAFTDDVETELLEIVATQLGPFQTHAFVVESTVRVDDAGFGCEVLALPDEAALAAALDALLVDRRDETTADPGDVF